jgi:predicted nucleic acid-binding protein
VTFVLDASVALAWCFKDEQTRYTRSMLEELNQTQAFVPAVWPLEVGSGLLIGERRRRLSPENVTELVALLDTLPVTVDVRSVTDGVGSVLPLARQHGLSTYDASYLELAIRMGLPLATTDRRLRNAANAADVSLAQPTR